MLSKIINWIRTHLPARIKTRYRGWRLTVTSIGVVGIKADGSENFIIGRLTSIGQGMRLGKNKIDRLEGPQAWDPNYTDQALR